MLTIRFATATDAAAIAHVHVQSWRTSYAGILPEPFLAGLQEADRVPLWQEQIAIGADIAVAELDGEIVGFVAGGVIREPVANFDGELYAIYLLQSAQCRGIGSALLGTLARALQSGNFRTLVVWVLASNAAVRFYQRSGARQVASGTTEVAGLVLPTLAFGWSDLNTIPSATPPVSRASPTPHAPHASR